MEQLSLLREGISPRWKRDARLSPRTQECRWGGASSAEERLVRRFFDATVEQPETELRSL